MRNGIEMSHTTPNRFNLRFWCEAANQMIYPESECLQYTHKGTLVGLAVVRGSPVYMYESGNWYGDSFELVPMQSTGFVDIKKKEIFERDILKCTFYDMLFKVEMCDGAWTMYPIKEEDSPFTSYEETVFYEWTANAMEVIGNIYESE